MSMCWFCYWGWPVPVADIYDKYLPLAGEGMMHYGPAHIVWDDENFERHHVQWCLDGFDNHRRDWPREGATDAEYEALRQSLKDLLALPDDVLYPVPTGFDDNDNALPQDYPPAIETRQR